MSALPLSLDDARYLAKTLEPQWDLEGRLLNGEGMGEQRSVQLCDADLLFLVEGLERRLSPEMSEAQIRRPARLLHEVTGLQFACMPVPGKRVYRLPYEYECEELGIEAGAPFFDETHSCFTEAGPGPVPLPDLRSCFLRGDRVQQVYRHLVRVQREHGVSAEQHQADYEKNREFCRERLLDVSIRKALNELEPRLVEQGFEQGRLSASPLGRFYLAMRMHFAFRIVKLGHPGLAARHLTELLAWDAPDYYRTTQHVAALQLVGQAFRGYRASLKIFEDDGSFWDLLRFLHSLQVEPDHDRARLLSALCDKNPHMLEELCEEDPTDSGSLETPLPPDFLPSPLPGSRLEARWAVQILRMAGAARFTVLICGLKEVFGHAGASGCRIPESLRTLLVDLRVDLVEEITEAGLSSREAGQDICLRLLNERVGESPWDLATLSDWQDRYLVRSVALATFALPFSEVRDGALDACLLFTSDPEYANLMRPLIRAGSPQEVCAQGVGYLLSMRQKMEDCLPLALGCDPNQRRPIQPELDGHITFECMHAQDLWNCNRSVEAIEHLESVQRWLGVEDQELIRLLLVRSLGHMDLARVHRLLGDLRAPDDLVVELIRFILAALAGRQEECRDIHRALNVMNPHLQPFLAGEKQASHGYSTPSRGSPKEAASAAFYLDMCWTMEVMAALSEVKIPEDLRIWPAPMPRWPSPALAPRSSSPGPSRAAAAKVGRNQPCPCGSGKKHKKCCG